VSSGSSPKEPVRINYSDLSLTDSVGPLLREFIAKHDYSAGMICCKYPGHDDYKVLLTHDIPIEPFNGAKSDSLNSFLADCHRTFPAPHIHSAKNSAFWAALKSLCSVEDWFTRCVFLPFQDDGDCQLSMIFLGGQESIKKLTDETIDDAKIIAQSTLLHTQYSIIKNNLKVMELYVKEVGHDISSSVQVIIAKLRNIRRGLVTGKAAERKLEEAESEIMATHRVADTLGIAVDPDYNIRSGSDLDINEVVHSVITLCESEAVERHSEIQHDLPEYPVTLWGDSKALESAITHLVINAIKYCYGGSTINVEVKILDGFVDVGVMNIGPPIEDDLEQRMWNFGVRGKRALEHHVNGSGIGLYTVKKIVKAHQGNVYFRSNVKNNSISVFGFKVPRGQVLDKTKLL